MHAIKKIQGNSKRSGDPSAKNRKRVQRPILSTLKGLPLPEYMVFKKINCFTHTKRKVESKPNS